jgi:hypothetical protein
LCESVSEAPELSLQLRMDAHGNGESPFQFAAHGQYAYFWRMRTLAARLTVGVSVCSGAAQSGINRHKFQSHTVMTKYLGEGFTQHLVDNAGRLAYYVLLTSIPCFLLVPCLSLLYMAHHGAVSPTATTSRVRIQRRIRLHALCSVEVREGDTS